MVKCLLCNNDFLQLYSHLRFKHHTYIDDYKKLFPEAKVISDENLNYLKSIAYKYGRDMHGMNNPMFGVHRYGKDSPTYGLHRYGKDAPMYGKYQRPETIEKISRSKIGHKIAKSLVKRERILNGDITPQRNAFRGVGYREDLQEFFNSRWEANVSRIFNFLKINQEYESKRCRFDLGNLGILIIDLYLPDLELYVEIKGYWTKKSKLKWQKFLEIYPLERVKLIDGEVYEELIKMFKDKIPRWEK